MVLIKIVIAQRLPEPCDKACKSKLPQVYPHMTMTIRCTIHRPYKSHDKLTKEDLDRSEGPSYVGQITWLVSVIGHAKTNNCVSSLVAFPTR